MKFSIKRNLDGKSVDINLTQEELDQIYLKMSLELTLKHISEEVDDLVINGSLDLKGNSKAVLSEPEFLMRVRRRWYKYNDNGGDQDLNLQEALSVTLSEYSQDITAQLRILRKNNLLDLKGNSESILSDPEFLEQVRLRWYKYNDNGGDQSENLQEAISDTLKERK